MVKRLDALIFTMTMTFVSFCNYSPATLFSQVKSRVIIRSSGSQIINDEIGKALSAVLQEVNKVAAGSGDMGSIEQYCRSDGFASLQDLVAKTGFFSTIPEYRIRILETLTGKFEVRGIKVRVKMGETKGDDVQELVFVLNPRLFIEDVHFAMEQHHYTRLLDEGKKLNDMQMRRHIFNFLEQFRTAHNRKDIDYLEKAYSDDALIIVGKVLEKQEGASDFLKSSDLTEEEVKLIRVSKKEYIERLQQVFKLNAFVRVTFEDVEISMHSKYPDIYGIYLKQKWQSSTYRDQGYLFVMMDFQELNSPAIHVRAWQPRKFADGSVVGLGDFKIFSERTLPQN